MVCRTLRQVVLLALSIVTARGAIFEFGIESGSNRITVTLTETLEFTFGETYNSSTIAFALQDVITTVDGAAFSHFGGGTGDIVYSRPATGDTGQPNASGTWGKRANQGGEVTDQFDFFGALTLTTTPFSVGDKVRLLPGTYVINSSDTRLLPNALTDTTFIQLYNPLNGEALSSQVTLQDAVVDSIIPPSPRILAMTSDGKLLQINATTGQGKFLASSGLTDVEALEARADRTLFAIADGDDLYTFAPGSLFPTLVADVTRSVFVSDLAFSANDTFLYASASKDADEAAEDLIRINPSNGQATTIGTFDSGFTNVEALSIDGANRGMAGSPGVNNTPIGVVTLNNGQLDFTLGSPPIILSSMDYAPDGTLYGVSIADEATGGASRLVTISRFTGGFTNIGPIGFDNIRALAVLPEIDSPEVERAGNNLLWAVPATLQMTTDLAAPESWATVTVFTGYTIPPATLALPRAFFRVVSP